MKLLTLVLTLFCVLVFSGCSSDNVLVTGNVTFEGDGQPVEYGAINFQNETKIYTGTINNGKYKSGGIKIAQAIQPGQYKVWFSNIVHIEYNSPDTADDDVVTSLIDDNYNSYRTTPLEITVHKGMGNFDIKLPRSKFKPPAK
jgi:hypothetical protein